MYHLLQIWGYLDTKSKIIYSSRFFLLKHQINSFKNQTQKFPKMNVRDLAKNKFYCLSLTGLMLGVSMSQSAEPRILKEKSGVLPKALKRTDILIVFKDGLRGTFCPTPDVTYCLSR